MLIDMKFFLAAEFIFVFFCGFILDCGQTQANVIRLSLALNLGLLAFVPGARVPADSSVDEPSTVPPTVDHP